VLAPSSGQSITGDRIRAGRDGDSPGRKPAARLVRRVWTDGAPSEPGGFIPRFSIAARMDKKEAEAVAHQLAKVPLFATMTERQLRAVAQVGLVRSYAANERVVSQGEKGVGFYLLLEGNMEVRSGGKTLATLNPGSFFGEMALFEDQARTADVVSSGPSRCMVLSRWEFWGSLSGDPDLLKVLMVELVRRLRGTTKALSE